MRPKLKQLIRKAIGDPPQLLEEMPNAPGLFHSYRELIATGHERVMGGWKYQGKFYTDYLTVAGGQPTQGSIPRLESGSRGRQGGSRQERLRHPQLRRQG